MWTMPLGARKTSLLLLIQICVSTGSRPRLEDSPPRIVEDPSDLIVSKGEPATLNCKAEGRPTPTVEWYKDGEHVETDKDDPRSHRMLLPSGSLFFLRIVHGRRSKPDEGVYTCVARNYLGEAVSRNASLEVATLRDDFRQAPNDVVVAVGEAAMLECIPPRGHPEPSISWKRNNVRVSDKDGRISMQSGKLIISHTRKSDAGMYVCVGSNMVGERDSDPAELVVFERPVFIRRPVNQIALAEETVEFLCEVHGDPAPTVRWRREEGELPRGRFEIHSDNSLRLLKVREEDEGTYTCMTENSVGKTEASAVLQVHVSPQITVQPRNQVSAQGRTVTFHCGTQGNPPPAVFWQKEGTQMLLFPGQPPSQAGRYSVSMSGELTIKDVHSEDSGYYVCQAISVAGSAISKAMLEVKPGPSDRVPPIIRQGPANQTLARGSTVLLQCHVTGSPPPSIRWEKDGQSLPEDDVHISLMENGTLHISGLQETDSGMYTCVASSSTGETSWSGTVTVRATGTSSLPRVSQALQLPGPPQKPVVTDVTQSSVTLTWQPNQHEGGAAVTSYIIEAFSQSVGSTWQTVADQVKQEKHTVSGLYPNTVYLFIVRAVNSYGLSDPSPISEPVRTFDGSPSGPAIDHRRIQTDLAEVTVYLHPPEILTPTSVQITWTVEREPHYIQGYRLLYRPVGSAWQVQDLKAGPKHIALLSELRRGTEYEFKLRPYFKEFQGSDSELVVVRTPEEVLSGPPQAVSVVQLGNSSSVRVSWEPPLTDGQDEPILEYKVWCIGNETGHQQQLNRSVDGEALWALLDGLVPELLYRVQVAAMTSAGAGAPSHPIFIFLKAPAGEPSLPTRKDDSISLSEQISGVVRQPAFIAGLGGASWMVLMGFSAWIYCRRRRRKELGHYATSFAYTPAVGLSHSDGSGLINGRPCLLGSNMGNYPWLADSWPTSNFTHTSKDSMTCCSGQHDSTDRYYNTVGITNFLKQSETYSPTSNEGPIYSTINPADEVQHDMSSLYSQGPDPYSSSPVLSKTDLFSLGQELDQWSLQSGHSTAEYAKLQYPSMGKATVGIKKSCGPATFIWSEVLSLPPPHTREQRHQERRRPSSDDDEEWCPPLPERTYLFESLENAATLPLRGEQSSRSTTYSHQSTSILTPSPHEEQRPAHPRLQHPDVLPCSKAPCTPMSQLPLPNPNLLTRLESHSGSLPHLTGHWRDIGQMEGLMSDNNKHLIEEFASFALEKTILSPVHQPRPKRKSPRDGRRREGLKPGDLPPPPEPPPAEDSLKQLAAMLESGSRTPQSRQERRAERRAASQWSTEDEELIQYCKMNMVPRSQVSSHCSPTASPSSLSSTASRTSGAARRRNENMI
ncbi:roundabout homolog 2-like isoform X1 [Pygocentrus nattereri]|uniref:roundabout homolog 2-like isoform X1 n=1 Tax=Pygocentrus nattereri TaxID=42514 RepID=UPI00081425B8|nr:roundabout homolog 2-like isoform X1 [Pygocentrus nattereri]